MAFDVPNTPVVGNTFSSGTKKWQWTGEQWAAKNPQGTGPWKTMSTTYTAVDGDRIAGDTSGGAFTISLPASPTTGNSVMFLDPAKMWNTNNLTIARNGSTIEGLSENFIINATGDMVLTMYYNGSTWRAYV